MSVRRSLAAMPAEFRHLLTGAAAAGLLASCGMPQPVEPPPPPFAEMEAPPELYGAPMQPELDPAAQAEAYAQADSAPPTDNPYADPTPVGEPQRPGWGTMEPIPNPPGSAPSRRERAYAERAPDVDLPSSASEPTLPRAEERIGAYGTGPTPAPPIYADRAPPPPAYEAPEAAPYAQGVPAASYPPVIVTMAPVPNPAERSVASAPSTAQPRPEPRVVRQAAVAPAVQTRRAARAAADQRLMGGPARGERKAVSQTARPTAAAAAESSARNAGATVRSAAASPNRDAGRSTAARPAAKLPAANTPAGRAARLKRMQGALAQLVQRDSTFAAPERIQPGRTERITLTLPQGLSEALTREAGTAGLRELASKAVVGVTLAGQGWRFEPEEPQTDELRAGRVNSFTWSATPERGAGPLTANVDARLSGGGRFETLQLGGVTHEIEGAGAQGLSGDGVGGLGWRTIGAALLLLALLIGGLFYARRGDDNGVGDASRRRFNRRRPDPVNLTPYSPSADTDAPVGPRDGDPEPSRP